MIPRPLSQDDEGHGSDYLLSAVAGHFGGSSTYGFDRPKGNTLPFTPLNQLDRIPHL